MKLNKKGKTGIIDLIIVLIVVGVGIYVAYLFGFIALPGFPDPGTPTPSNPGWCSTGEYCSDILATVKYEYAQYTVMPDHMRILLVQVEESDSYSLGLLSFAEHATGRGKIFYMLTNPYYEQFIREFNFRLEDSVDEINVFDIPIGIKALPAGQYELLIKMYAEDIFAGDVQKSDYTVTFTIEAQPTTTTTTTTTTTEPPEHGFVTIEAVYPTWPFGDRRLDNAPLYLDGQYKGKGYWEGIVTVGEHIVSFGYVEGWVTPDSEQFYLAEDQRKDIKGLYWSVGPWRYGP